MGTQTKLKNINIEILLPTLRKQFDNLDNMLGFFVVAVYDWERASSNNNLYTVY